MLTCNFRSCFTIKSPIKDSPVYLYEIKRNNEKAGFYLASNSDNINTCRLESHLDFSEVNMHTVLHMEREKLNGGSIKYLIQNNYIATKYIFFSSN